MLPALVRNLTLTVAGETPRGPVPIRLAGRRLGAPGHPRKVLFLHGVGITADTWRVAQPVVAAHADTVALDLAGFGASVVGPDVDVTMAAQGRLVARVLDALGWRRAVLVGHSMGGGAGLAAALWSPERVAGLVQVAGAATRQRVPIFFPPLRLPGAAHGLWLLTRAVHALGLSTLYGRLWSHDPAIAGAFLAAMRRLPHDQAFCRCVRDLRPARYTRYEQRYPLLRQPLLILHGDRDPIVPCAVGRALHRLVPHSELQVIPGGDHMFHEWPEHGVGARVVAFLERWWAGDVDTVHG